MDMSTPQCRKFCFVFGKTVQPSVGDTTERLEVTAGLLEGTLGPTTKLSARLDHCIAAAYEVQMMLPVFVTVFDSATCTGDGPGACGRDHAVCAPPRSPGPARVAGRAVEPSAGAACHTAPPLSRAAIGAMEMHF